MQIITKTKVGTDEWNLDRVGVRAANRIARRLELTLEEFLARLSSGQLQADHCEKKDLEKCAEPPKGFSVTPPDDLALWRRVERVAKADGVSVEMFIWSSIASMVSCAEEDIIVHPETGEALGSRVQEFEQYRTRHVLEGTTMRVLRPLCVR